MKDSSLFFFLAMGIDVVLTSAGQLINKKGADRLVTKNGLKTFIKSFFNIYIIIGAIIFFVAPVFYLYALKGLSLHVAYSLTALNYILVFTGGWLIFKEKVNGLHIIGLALIIIGVLVFNL